MSMSALNDASSLAAASSPFEFRERVCPTCGIEARRVLGMRGGKHHRYGLGIATRIVQCQRCHLIFPNPFPYAIKPSEIYGDPDKLFGPPNPRIAEICTRMVREVAQMSGKKNPSMLDVGCGRGQLMGAAKAEGFTRVLGLEISEAMIAEAKANYDVEVRRQSVEELAQSTKETFDAVTLSAVLEHVYDPDSMIAAIHSLTHPGSIVYIDVPCEPNLLTHVGNAVNRLRRDQSVFNLSPTWAPYHVFGFNRRALTTLLEKHGFKLEKLDIWAAPEIPSRGHAKDRLRAFAGTQINRVANVLHMSANMSGWARHV